MRGTLTGDAINLITRFASGARNFKMFADEATGLAWLDEVQG